MRAIIHSVHSQATETLGTLTGVRTVVSLDSHLDVSAGGDDGVYPRELLAIAKRTSAHTEMRRIIDASPARGGRLVVVIPESMLAAHALDVEASLPPDVRLHDARASVASVVEFMRSRGIEVVQSPPRNLSELVPLFGHGDAVLDIDVDYMEEMQEECYTRIFDAGAGVLQSAARVVELVRAARPETILISEVRTSSLRDPGSAFSAFLASLRESGYAIEERDVATDDGQVTRGIAICYEFYRSVSRRLMLNHRAEMARGNFGGFQRDERAAAKAFFAQKGYGH